MCVHVWHPNRCETFCPDYPVFWSLCISLLVFVFTCAKYHQLRKKWPCDILVSIWIHTFYLLLIYNIPAKYLQNWAIVCIGIYQYYSQWWRPDYPRKYSMAEACIAKGILALLIVAFSSKELILTIMKCGFIPIDIETKDW